MGLCVCNTKPRNASPHTNAVRSPSITHLGSIVSRLDIRQSSGSHGGPGGGREGEGALWLLVEWLIINILETRWSNDRVGPQGRRIISPRPKFPSCWVHRVDNVVELRLLGPRGEHEPSMKGFKRATWAATEKFKWINAELCFILT